MSLYESFLKEAVETLQIVKDELKNDPVRIFKEKTKFLKKKNNFIFK
jgi:hypothetical protein